MFTTGSYSNGPVFFLKVRGARDGRPKVSEELRISRAVSWRGNGTRVGGIEDRGLFLHARLGPITLDLDFCDF